MNAGSPIIDYDHSRNLHTLEGPRTALSILLQGLSVLSVLDVGCGKGTWLKAAMDLGIRDVVGVDGVPIPSGELLFPIANFLNRDLAQPLDVGRKFDLVVCLEVAEHLEEASAGRLIENLVRHADRVYFSAACPGQPGQHHVNCQWPAYWQRLFNQKGYVCADWPRWAIWDNRQIEPWYRQNMILASRDPDRAGKEGRISGVIHPDFLSEMQSGLVKRERNAVLSGIGNGAMPSRWYLSAPAMGLWRKIMRGIRLIPPAK